MASYHILVPLDLSEYADHVLDHLLTFINTLTTRTGTLQTQVTLLHVIEPPQLPGVAEHVVLELRQPEAWAQRKLADDYAPRVRDAGVLCNVSLKHGVPAQEIVEAARASQVNMIMMGTHGHSGIPHMMLGSVADKVLRLAPCPVMVIRPPEEALSC